MTSDKTPFTGRREAGAALPWASLDGQMGYSSRKTIAGLFAITTPNGQVFASSEEDAAFIVRACNAHEQMVKALEAIVANAVIQPDANMANATDCYAVPLDDIDAARAALQRAKEDK